MEIRSGGFDSEDLQQIFGGTETDDGTRVAVTSDELKADLSDVDPGQYSFTFDVTDADAESSVTVQVSEPKDMTFADDNLRAATGDTATINITMESGASGQLVAGSPDKGYEAKIGFEDSDDDGDVSLTMNTYLAGNHTGSGEREAWSADGDEITAVELTTTPLDEQLDPANYELTVRSGGQQQDIGMLVLADPTVSNLTLWTAPARQFEESMTETTRTKTDRVAVGDLLIAEVTGEGLFGLLERQAGEDVTERFRSLVQSRNASFWLELQDENRATDPPRTDLDESFANDAFHVISDPENQTLYITMDEESLQFEKGRSSVQPRDSYEVLFELRDDSGVVSTDQVVRSTVAFTDRSATFETGEGDQLWLPASGNATINGSTTVAPGTELYFRLRLNGTLSEGIETTVQSNRTFAAPVDLSETTPGTNVSVNLRDFEAKAHGAIRESWSEPTEPTTPTSEPPVTTVTPTTSAEPTDVRDTETTAEPTDESTPTPDTRTAATASNDDVESTSQATTADGPGFSAGIAAIAVVGFALLLTRRRSWD